MTINNVHGIGVGLNTNLPQQEAQPEAKEHAVKEEAAANAPGLKLMSGDEILGVMAQQAALNKPAGVEGYDVAKYVTPEQAKRIAGFVASFEDIVVKNLEAVSSEFGDSLSEEAKAELALKMTD